MPRKTTTKEAKKEDEAFDKFLEILDESGGDDKGGALDGRTGIKPTEVAGTSVTFKDFMLRPGLMKALQENTFEAPSIIQQEAIPSGILGTDLLCQAQSGSGKTCVFVLTVLQQLKVRPGSVQCICIAPTRELAYQIKGEFVRFSKHIEGVSVACFTGGFPEAKDRKILEVDPPTIVVGTPGRLGALLSRPVGRGGEPDACLDLSNVQFLIIDECDQIMNNEKLRKDAKLVHAAVWGGLPASSIGIKRNGKLIRPYVDSAVVVSSGLATLKKKVQTMMFSATLDSPSLKLAREMYPNAQVVPEGEELESEALPSGASRKEIFIDNPTKQLLSGIIQRVIMVKEKNKNPILGALLESIQFTQLVIFVSTHERAERLAFLLDKCGHKAICTHANLRQEQREARCTEFRDMKYRILVATDLLHRGIDIPAVNAVINYDMPENPDIYLHRIGRAGRFSTYGLAISFCVPDTPEEKAKRLAKQEAMATALAAAAAVTTSKEADSEASATNNVNTINADNTAGTTATPAEQTPRSNPTFEHIRKTNEETLAEVQCRFAKAIPELVIDGSLEDGLTAQPVIKNEALEGISGWRRQKEE